MSDRTELAASRAAFLFKIVEDMGVPCGYERSFKMLDGRLLANRFLLGIGTADMPASDCLEVCRRLGMPTEFQDSLERRLADANLMFLGFEDNEVDCVYKVYLEFWDLVQRDMRESNNNSPRLLHIGFKWKIHDKNQSTITRYTYSPSLSLKDIVGRMSDIYEGHGDPVAEQITERIIGLAARGVSNPPFIYVEVNEQGNRRRSFDINLYHASLRVRDIWPFLLIWQRHCSIPRDRFARLQGLVSGKLLGHLAGGRSREGEEFLAVYYEA